MITGNVNELNQVKSVINNSMSIVHVFLGELMMQKNIKGHTEAEAELMEALETLFQAGTEVNMSIDLALQALSADHGTDSPKDPPEDLPPWEGEEEEQ